MEGPAFVLRERSSRLGGAMLTQYRLLDPRRSPGSSTRTSFAHLCFDISSSHHYPLSMTVLPQAIARPHSPTARLPTHMLSSVTHDSNGAALVATDTGATSRPLIPSLATNPLPPRLHLRCDRTPPPPHTTALRPPRHAPRTPRRQPTACRAPLRVYEGIHVISSTTCPPTRRLLVERRR